MAHAREDLRAFSPTHDLASLFSLILFPSVLQLNVLLLLLSPVFSPFSSKFDISYAPRVVIRSGKIQGRWAGWAINEVVSEWIHFPQLLCL